MSSSTGAAVGGDVHGPRANAFMTATIQSGSKRSPDHATAERFGLLYAFLGAQIITQNPIQNLKRRETNHGECGNCDPNGGKNDQNTEMGLRWRKRRKKADPVREDTVRSKGHSGHERKLGPAIHQFRRGSRLGQHVHLKKGAVDPSPNPAGVQGKKVYKFSFWVPTVGESTYKHNSDLVKAI